MTSNGNPVITGSGITVQANIRRFDFSDKKELQYRAEIQNKVYKRELVALEEEISRLEMLLEIPAITYFRLTEELLKLMPEGDIDINVITASLRGGGPQSITSISDADDMVSYFGDSTDDSRQQMDDDEFGEGLSGKSPKKILAVKKRQTSSQYAEYELNFDEITDGLFLDKTDDKGTGSGGEKKKKKGGWEKININKLTTTGSKARAFFSGKRTASLRNVGPTASTTGGETAVNTAAPQPPMALLSQRLQFQLKQAASLSKQRLQHQAQSLPSPQPGLQRSVTQPSPPLSPLISSKKKPGDPVSPHGDQSKTVRFTVESFEVGGGSEDSEGETSVRSRQFEKEKHPGKIPGSLSLSASSSSLRIGSPSLLNVTPTLMSISTPVSPNSNESTDLNLGTEPNVTPNLPPMKFSLHKILTPKIIRELKLQNQRELLQEKLEAASEMPMLSTEVLPPPPSSSSSSNSTTDTTTTTTTTYSSNISGSSTSTNMASTLALDDTEAVASMSSSHTPSFTLASILQLRRQQSSSPTSSRSSAEILSTSEGTAGETIIPSDTGDSVAPVPSIFVIGATPKTFSEEPEMLRESSPSKQKPSSSGFKSTSKTWARAAARAAAKAATKAAAKASAAAVAAASSVKSSSSSSLSSALSSSTSTSSTGLHLHLRSPEPRSPNPQILTPVRVSSSVVEEGVSEEATGQTSDQEQFDIPSAEGMEKVIDNERKIRIKRLQRDLTRIQKELQALDDLEYEVSYV